MKNSSRPLASGGGTCYNEGMKTLVMCCDYGVDDAAATVDMLMHAAADAYDGAALVAIAGNVPAAVSLANAKKLVAHLPFRTVPVTVVDTTREVQPAEFLKHIHGNDGMGDLFADDRGFCAPVVPFSAWLETLPAAYDLLSLGPATLVPRILARGGVERLVLMGGNIAETPNYHGYEFNHALDRAAFSAVTQNFPHVAATMDTCRHPRLNVQPLAVEGEGLMARIVRRAQAMTRVSGEKGCYLWDDIAAKVLRHPEWFALRERTDRDGNVLTVAEYTHTEPYLKIMEQ